MMLGLESHIPMYMTGQISPYYLKNAQNNVFLHFLKVSGSAALSGEAIAGHHAEGRYHLTSVKSDVEYYTRRANDLLRCAKPLMDIYRERVLQETLRRDENALTRAGHMAICQALRDRDEDAAAAAVYEHLVLIGGYRESLIEQNGEDGAKRHAQEAAL